MQKRPLKANETLDLKTAGSLFNVKKKTNETPNVSIAFPVAVRCSALQCIAVCCSGRMRPRMSHSLFPLQCVAVCCSGRMRPRMSHSLFPNEMNTDET